MLFGLVDSPLFTRIAAYQVRWQSCTVFLLLCLGSEGRASRGEPGRGKNQPYLCTGFSNRTRGAKEVLSVFFFFCYIFRITHSTSPHVPQRFFVAYRDAFVLVFLRDVQF